MASRKRKASDSDDGRETTAGPSAAALPASSAIHGDGYYRNLYAREPDFRQLGKYDAQFAAL
jgi:hypothetical protein